MRKDQLHASEDRARAYPVLPIRNSVLFPNLILPLTVGRPASVAAIDTALASEDRTIVVVAQRDPATDDIGPADLYEVGTLATIKRLERQDDAMHLLVFGTDRVELGEVESGEPYLRLKVRRLPKPKDETTEVDALHREVLEVANQISELLAPHTPVALIDVVMQTKDMMQQLYLLASLLSMEVSRAQALLTASTRQQALEKMHEFLSYELQVLQLRHKIASQASTEIGREQREYLLRQQMKAIQEELGGKSPEEAETDELRRRLDEAELPDKVRQESRVRSVPPVDAAGPLVELIEGWDHLPSLEELERRYIQVLLKHEPRKSRIAEILGKDRTTLYRKLKDLGLGEGSDES